MEEQLAETKILGVEITVDEIKAKIANLSTIPDMPNLKNAMNDLKRALRQNPAACNLLLPEDIGQMVQHLYKVTNTVVLQAKAKDLNKAAKKVDLNDPNVINKAMDEL